MVLEKSLSSSGGYDDEDKSVDIFTLFLALPSVPV